MSFKTKQLRVGSTLFGLFYDNAAPEGMDNIQYLISRARKPKTPKNSTEAKIEITPKFESLCASFGYKLAVFMRGREYAREMETRFTLTMKDGTGLKIIESTKNDFNPADPKHRWITVRLQSRLSETVSLALIGQPLEALVTIDGPIGTRLAGYHITKVFTGPEPEGTSTVYGKLPQGENHAQG